MDRLKNIEETYKLVKEELDKKLHNQGYSLKTDEYHKESFGSRYCVWVNLDELIAIRLIWDGRDSWFILEESPASKTQENFAWADIGIFPFDPNNRKLPYRNEIVKSIVNEIN